jgi:2,3-bisphosphoglycerate-independent phosphoglycerate mutase
VFPDTLIHDSGTKILLCVMDGLGDIPGPGRHDTPLEAARTPNLDALAREGTVGLFTPVAAGVTPGSGPGHLALFGYDPSGYEVGRGVLSALGVDFTLQPGDVAARFNFCSLDAKGNITDRRAGRLPTETNRRLVDALRAGVHAPDGVTLFWETESEHRGVLVLRGPRLHGDLTDTDPQEAGKPPLSVRAGSEAARPTAALVGKVIAAAHDVIRHEHPANGLLLRGFATLPHWPDMAQRFGVRAAAVAKYPMYRGVARLVGMHVLDPYRELVEAPALLKAAWPAHDFFFLHFKDPDKAGEDGDFERKQKAIEAFDAIVPELLALRPDVLVATGDHSTPVAMRQHSWHPVPVLLHAPATCRPDAVERFGERWAVQGGLGQRPMHELMSLMLAHAGRLMKFGA